MHNAHIVAYLEHLKLLNHAKQEQMNSLQFNLFGFMDQSFKPLFA